MDFAEGFTRHTLRKKLWKKELIDSIGNPVDSL